jgi:UDP-N-acetyl-D-glucosamine dehydrogenase
MMFLGECDVVVICVPTPLTMQREPNLRFVMETGQTIAAHLRAGQLVVLESTTWPGTTNEVLRSLLEASGLVCGQDFFVGFSPERENPGSLTHTTVSIPKVVAGHVPEAQAWVATFYSAFIDKVVPVSTTDAAETVKITENIFRAVNVALVNELKLVYDAMRIDIWEGR